MDDDIPESGIQLKNREDIIKECHRLLFDGEHVLVVIPLYTDNLGDLLKKLHEEEVSGETGIEDVMKQQIPTRILIEKFSKRMQEIEILNLKKIFLSDKAVNEIIKGLPKPFCVLIYDKPKSWKRFSCTDEKREKIRDDFKNHRMMTDYVGTEKSPHDEQLTQDVVGIALDWDAQQNLDSWMKLKILQHEYQTLSYASKSLIAFIKSDLSNLTDTQKEAMKFQILLDQGIRHDSAMAVFLSEKLFSINRQKLGNVTNIGGRLYEMAVPGIKLQEFVDPKKLAAMKTDYEKIEDIENIKEWLEFAIHLDPQNYFAWYTLGLIRYRMLDYSHAENDFIQCINSNPEWYLAYKLLARIYKNQGFYRKAIVVLNIGLEKAEKHHKAINEMGIAYDAEEMYSTRGEIFLDAENYEDAINDFDWCIDFLLENWEKFLKKQLELKTLTHHLLCKIAALRNLEKIPEMIDVYKIMEDKFPNSTITMNNMAFWYKQIGDKENSLKYYNKVLEIDSELWTANLGVAEILMEDGKRQEANPYAKAASKKCPQEYSSDIMEMRAENMEKILEEYENKTFEEQVKNLGGFSLSSKEEENDRLAVQMLQKCEEFIFWIDPYFSAGGLNWIEKTCQQPTSVKKVEILTQFSGGKNARPEIFSPKFRKKFDKLRDVLSIEDIELSMRICMDKEHCKLHSRYIMTNKGRSWNIPSVMNFKRGTEDDVGPSTKNRDDFEDIWNKSFDYVKDQKEAEEKYEELKGNLDSEIT